MRDIGAALRCLVIRESVQLNDESLPDEEIDIMTQQRNLLPGQDAEPREPMNGECLESGVGRATGF